jgi:hypothetical protein
MLSTQYHTVLTDQPNKVVGHFARTILRELVLSKVCLFAVNGRYYSELLLLVVSEDCTQQASMRIDSNISLYLPDANNVQETLYLYYFVGEVPQELCPIYKYWTLVESTSTSREYHLCPCYKYHQYSSSCYLNSSHKQFRDRCSLQQLTCTTSSTFVYRHVTATSRFWIPLTNKAVVVLMMMF